MELLCPWARRRRMVATRSSRALLAGILVLFRIGSTLQDQHAWHPGPPGSSQAARPAYSRAVEDLTGGVMVPRRTPSPDGSAAVEAAGLWWPQQWDAAGDRLCGNHVFGSPVTDSDPSEAARPSSVSGTWVAGIPGMVSDDWHLPPAFGDAGLAEDEGSMAAMEPLTDDSAGSSEDGSGGRRRCDLCKLMDATRGVAEDGEAGRWKTLVCRHCSQFMKSTVALSTRCLGCRRYANFGPIGGSRRDARHCKRHRLPTEINVSRKRCDFRSKLAHASPLHRHSQCSGVPVVSFRGSNYCSWHAKNIGDTSVAGDPSDQMSFLLLPQKKYRQCIRENCQQYAGFGDAETGAILCSRHRESHHVDLVHKKRCEHSTCDKNPSYGLPAEGVARFCKEHRPGSYVDLRSRKCQHPYGCSKRPSFGDLSDGIARFCMVHKLARHVNVKSKKCQEQGCAKQPTFGARDDMVVRFCAVHRRLADIDLVHARCRQTDCQKTALFGFKGGSPQFCYIHRRDRMVNIQRPDKGVLPHPAGSEQPVVSMLPGWGDASMISGVSPGSSPRALCPSY